MEKIRILIACEQSDTVRSRFEKLGFDAWSCDILPNENPQAKHHQGDLFEIMDNNKWDAMIAFPPCTHLANSGAMWFEQKRLDGRQQQGIDFFMAIVNAKIPHIAIENPIGIMSRIYQKPTQIIQPYYFGDKAQKTTCLWLKNLPPLYHNATANLFDSKVTHTDKGEFYEWVDKKYGRKKKQPLWYKQARDLKPEERSRVRSKTFEGIAQAMADQWGKYLKEVING